MTRAFSNHHNREGSVARRRMPTDGGGGDIALLGHWSPLGRKWPNLNVTPKSHHQHPKGANLLVHGISIYTAPSSHGVKRYIRNVYDVPSALCANWPRIIWAHAGPTNGRAFHSQYNYQIDPKTSTKRPTSVRRPINLKDTRYRNISWGGSAGSIWVLH